MKKMKERAVKRIRLVPLMLAVGIAASGCAGTGKDRHEESLADIYLRDGPPATQGGLAAMRALEDEDVRTPLATDTSQAPNAIILEGTDRMLAPMKKPAPVVQQDGETVTLEFADAPLSEVVQALLGDMLKLTYTVEHMPQGTVSLRTGGPIARDNVLSITESMLQSYGAALVEDAHGIYHITQLANVQQYAPTLYRAEDLPPGFGLVVVPLRYIGAAEMSEILQPVAPPGSIVRVDPLRNLIILGGNRAQHEGWLEIVRSFDVDYLKGMSLGIFPLEYATVDDIFDSINALLGGTISDDSSSGGGGAMAGLLKSAAAGGAPGAAGTPAAGPSGPSASIGAAVRLFPVQRLNSLIAVSSRAEHLETIRRWITSLDQPAFNDLEPRLYVYPVQNGSASHLAELLSGLYSGTMGGSGTRRTDSGIAPGLNQTSLTGGNRSSTSTRTTTSTSTSSSSSGSGSSISLPDTDAATTELLTQVELGEQVKVVADEQNNALLILAPRRDYRKIESALRQLDQSPTQILIEASIVEVQLKGALTYGVEWYLGRHRGGSSLLNGRTIGDSSSGSNSNNSTIINRGPLTPIGNGGSFWYAAGDGTIEALLSMLASNSMLRVLSNPKLLVQDNYTASIHVGTQQPVQTGYSRYTNSDTRDYNIEWRDTGVMLTVTPSANAGGLVNMTIHQSVTDVGAEDDVVKQRVFMQREIKSRVSVRSGETIVMGGLIQDKRTDGRSGIPGLHNIPVIGNLFGSTSEETDRTELLVLMTPRIMVNEAELRAVSDEIRSRMRTTMMRPEAVKSLPPEKVTEVVVTE